MLCARTSEDAFKPAKPIKSDQSSIFSDSRTSYLIASQVIISDNIAQTLPKRFDLGSTDGIAPWGRYTQRFHCVDSPHPLRWSPPHIAAHDQVPPRTDVSQGHHLFMDVKPDVRNEQHWTAPHDSVVC